MVRTPGLPQQRQAWHQRRANPAFFIAVTPSTMPGQGALPVHMFSTTLPAMKNSLLLACCLSIGLAATAQAEIYKNVDANGHVTYSNVPSKGAKKLDLEPSANTGFESKPRTRTATPSDFPRVDKQTQVQRDQKRKKILEEELATEKKVLEDAKKTYAENQANAEFFRANNLKEPGNIIKYDENLKRLEAEVESHKKNVELLQKELDSFK
jgi:hypothetical protein